MSINLMNFAIAYAKKGFSVIPISPESKRPLIKFANLPPLTVEEITALWCKYPNANIALRTDKFIVLDVDRHEIDGFESLKKLHHPEWFANTLTEKTAHNGLHFFYRKPKNIKMTQVIGILPGVDLKANKNNYVVVAPSTFDYGNYKWLTISPMKDVPKDMLEWIQAKKGVVNRVKISTVFNNGLTKAGEKINILYNGLGDIGKRNDTLASLMGWLLRQGIDAEQAFNLCINANNNTPNPLSEREVYATCTSILESEIRRLSGNG